MRFATYLLLMAGIVGLFRLSREAWQLEGLTPLAASVDGTLDAALVVLGWMGTTLVLYPYRSPEDDLEAPEPETHQELTRSLQAGVLLGGATTMAASLTASLLDASPHWSLWFGFAAAVVVAAWWSFAGVPWRAVLRFGFLWATCVGAAFAGMLLAVIAATLLMGIWVIAMSMRLLLPDE